MCQKEGETIIYLSNPMADDAYAQFSFIGNALRNMGHVAHKLLWGSKEDIGSRGELKDYSLINGKLVPAEDLFSTAEDYQELRTFFLNSDPWADQDSNEATIYGALSEICDFNIFGGDIS